MSARRSDRLASGRPASTARPTPSRFTFDGTRYHRPCPATRWPRRCSPTASRLVGRSFKYHRPRGILTAGSEEPNALVELRDGARREPNTRGHHDRALSTASTRRSQNRWPSLRFDLLAVNRCCRRCFAAGFYYKTFMWPAVVLGEGLRAADPPRRRPRPRRRRCPIPTATRSAHAVLRRAGDRRRPGRPRRRRWPPGAQRRARDAVRGGSPPRRPAAGRARTRWTASPAPAGRRKPRPSSRCMPRRAHPARTTVFGAYDHGTYGALERVADHLPDRPTGAAAPALWQIVAQPRGAGRRRDRAAAGVRRQRPAGRDAGRRACAPTSNATPCAGPHARGASPTMTMPPAPSRHSRGTASRSPPWSTRGPRYPRRSVAWPTRRARHCSPALRSPAS